MAIKKIMIYGLTVRYSQKSCTLLNQDKSKRMKKEWQMNRRERERERENVCVCVFVCVCVWERNQYYYWSVTAMNYWREINSGNYSTKENEAIRFNSMPTQTAAMVKCWVRRKREGKRDMNEREKVSELDDWEINRKREREREYWNALLLFFSFLSSLYIRKETSATNNSTKESTQFSRLQKQWVTCD